jgi:chloramphenicol 3-O-phosphotransferase
MVGAIDVGAEGGGGTLIWLVGGPSVGKSSTARAIQRAGGSRDCWVLAGDQHLLRLCPADQVVRYGPPIDDLGDWWDIPYLDGRVIGRPQAGRRALRLLAGMYGGAVAMARAGNNVILEDVVWDAAVAAIALDVLGAFDVFTVRLVCPHAVAVARERARRDRFDGGVAAYASGPELVDAVDATFDSALHDRDVIARRILGAIAAKPAGRGSGTDGRERTG